MLICNSEDWVLNYVGLRSKVTKEPYKIISYLSMSCYYNSNSKTGQCVKRKGKQNAIMWKQTVFIQSCFSQRKD